VQSVFELVMQWRRHGDGRRGVIVLVTALAIFLVALLFTSTSAYGATKKKQKVQASISRGQLNVLGTRGNDRVTLRLKPGNPSRLQVDVGSDGHAEHTFKRSRFSRIVVHTGAGSDAITIDESYGGFTATEATSLFGDAGSDVVIGKGSNAAEAFDLSPDGSRLRYSRNGHALRASVERFALNALGGADRVTIEGTAGSDNINVAASAVARHIAVSAGSPIDIVNAEALQIEGLAGNDTLSGGIGLAALTQLTLDGGAGNDVINGGDGNDLLLGGSENDAIDGNRGDDTGRLGAGDDSFTWDPGDGSDKVEGEAGTDTMVFNGAAAAENFDLSANGNRLRFFRNVGNITMDADDTERVDVRALGGIDNTVVNDLAATDVKSVVLDLAADGAVDTTTINGTAGNDAISIAPNAGAVDVTGLAASVQIKGSQAADDVLNVNGLDGDDTISGAVGLAALIKLEIDGGPGNDTINGGDGNETLRGGDGNDAVDGNQGADTGILGAGDDSFRWDPGDGSDIVEGQAGNDTMLFLGAGAAENFDVSANDGRVRFFRNLGNITMDLDDTERIDLRALGGIDNTVVNDLSGTDTNEVDVDLAGAIGGNTGDGAADTVTVNGSQAGDAVEVVGTAGQPAVEGLAAVTRVHAAEVPGDALIVNGKGGDDNLSAPGLPAAVVALTLDGDAGEDTVVGGQGADNLIGGTENDFVDGNQGADTGTLGDGGDTFQWDPGDGSDIVEGGPGSDLMLFNGAAVAEQFAFSANGPRLRFTRNLGNIVMDTDDVEVVDLNALGGPDAVEVNDLTGTDVTKAKIDLAAAIGGDTVDGAADAITVNGTDGDDNVAVEAGGAAVDIVGLFTGLTITNSEAANDSLEIDTLGGDDDVTVGDGVADLIQTIIDLGSGE
jgi:Ca2+-binding RTX toxin-like protein